MAAGLGKGLKPGGELFKKTEPAAPASEATKAQSSKAAKEQTQIQGKAQEHKGADVRKHIVLPEALYERLRRFCFDRRAKEARVVREALDMYLTKEGF
jgi:hypothetical protein